MELCNSIVDIDRRVFYLGEKLGKLNHFVSDGHWVSDDMVSPSMNIAIFRRFSSDIKF